MNFPYTETLIFTLAYFLLSFLSYKVSPKIKSFGKSNNFEIHNFNSYFPGLVHVFSSIFLGILKLYYEGIGHGKESTLFTTNLIAVSFISIP